MKNGVLVIRTSGTCFAGTCFGGPGSLQDFVRYDQHSYLALQASSLSPVRFVLMYLGHLTRCHSNQEARLQKPPHIRLLFLSAQQKDETSSSSGSAGIIYGRRTITMTGLLYFYDQRCICARLTRPFCVDFGRRLRERKYPLVYGKRVRRFRGSHWKMVDITFFLTVPIVNDRICRFKRA